MKLTAKVKLQSTKEQAELLLHTLKTANAACNWISEQGWQTQTFGQFTLHKLTYKPVRELFGLTAQMVVRCISKVADAYKLDKATKRTFKPHGGIAYDDRILNWRLKTHTVSIWTMGGRQTIPFVCGQRQWDLLQTQQGETDLGYINGEFYLFAVCNVDEPTPDDIIGVLGVDMGVTNIAVDSDGTTSRTCPCCGHVNKANRPSQSKFSCVSCGFAGLADHIAAINIGRRASVTRPNVSTTDIDFYQ